MYSRATENARTKWSKENKPKVTTMATGAILVGAAATWFLSFNRFVSAHIVACGVDVDLGMRGGKVGKCMCLRTSASWKPCSTVDATRTPLHSSLCFVFCLFDAMYNTQDINNQAIINQDVGNQETKQARPRTMQAQLLLMTQGTLTTTSSTPAQYAATCTTSLL